MTTRVFMISRFTHIIIILLTISLIFTSGCTEESTDKDTLIEEVETRLLDKNNLSAKIDHEFLWIKIDTTNLDDKDSIIATSDFKLKDNDGTVYEDSQLKTITNASSTDSRLVWLIFEIPVSETAVELIYETEEKQESFTLPDYQSVGKSGYTEFFVLNKQGKASDYPTNLTVNKTATIIIGITNNEGATLNYELCIGLGTNYNNMKMKGDIAKDYNLNFKKNNTYFKTDTIIQNNKTWEKNLNFTLQISNLHRLSLWLKRRNEVYRTLHLWIEVNE